MEKKLVIQFGEHRIIAEVCNFNEPGIPPEMYVYLMDNKNTILQDICLVRPHYDIDRNTMEFKQDNAFVDCLVWGESGYEDYTDKFVIGVYEEEEN